MQSVQKRPQCFEQEGATEGSTSQSIHPRVSRQETLSQATYTFGQPTKNKCTPIPKVQIQEPKGSHPTSEELPFPCTSQSIKCHTQSSPHQQGRPNHEFYRGHEHQTQQSGTFKSVKPHKPEQPQTPTIGKPSQPTQGQVQGSERRETLNATNINKPLYIEHTPVDITLSPFEHSLVRLVREAHHVHHDSSFSNFYVSEVTVMAPNGPRLNQYRITHTVGNSLTSNSHSHTQTLDKPLIDYMSPGACHTVNRKFIEDLLLLVMSSRRRFCRCQYRYN